MKKAFTLCEFALAAGIIFGIMAAAICFFPPPSCRSRDAVARNSDKAESARLFNPGDDRPQRTGKPYIIHVDRTRFPQMRETLTSYDVHVVSNGWCKFWLEDGTEVNTSLSNVIIIRAKD